MFVSHKARGATVRHSIAVYAISSRMPNGSRKSIFGEKQKGRVKIERKGTGIVRRADQGDKEGGTSHEVGGSLTATHECAQRAE